MRLIALRGIGRLGDGLYALDHTLRPFSYAPTRAVGGRSQAALAGIDRELPTSSRPLFLWWTAPERLSTPRPDASRKTKTQLDSGPLKPLLSAA